MKKLCLNKKSSWFAKSKKCSGILHFFYLLNSNNYSHANALAPNIAASLSFKWLTSIFTLF